MEEVDKLFLEKEIINTNKKIDSLKKQKELAKEEHIKRILEKKIIYETGIIDTLKKISVFSDLKY